MKNESDCDCYYGEVEDIPVHDSRSDTSISEVEITNLDSLLTYKLYNGWKQKFQVYHTAQNI
jgi:hypothetical protein